MLQSEMAGRVPLESCHLFGRTLGLGLALTHCVTMASPFSSLSLGLLFCNMRE